MDSVTVVVDGSTVELTEDASGYRGTVDIEGHPHMVFATITRCGPPAKSPAKARLLRYVRGVEVGN